MLLQAIAFYVFAAVTVGAGAGVVISRNPVYSAPADLNFATAMERVPLRAH